MDTEKIEQILLSKGIKPTSNRILVARVLLRSSHPISLADIEYALDTLDKSSIFRVLELLAQKEAIHVIEDGSRSLKYEMCHSHDRHTIEDQHVHFYCEECKETFCLENVKIPVIDIPEGFYLKAVNYMLKGICPECSGHKNS